MKKNYTTLIFDAFDTVVHINRSKLPSYQLEGKTIYTTAPAVHSAYADHFGKIAFDVFYAAFSQSYLETEQIRRVELKEVTNQERFRGLLRRLGHEADLIPVEFLDALTIAHMDQLQDALEVRPETVEFLDWAAGKFRRGMISNFDYAPALYRALDRFGIRSAFETIMISVEVGWRKPHKLIFEKAFAEMGVNAAEALFIGDQLYLDVMGARQSGMDVVWLDAGREVWTPDFPEPTYKVQSITEVIPILESLG